MDKNKKIIKELKKRNNILKSVQKIHRIPIGIQMLETGFDFIAKNLKITDIEKYKMEHNIAILKEDKELGKYQGRIIFNNGTKQIINLYEPKSIADIREETSK